MTALVTGGASGIGFVFSSTLLLLYNILLNLFDFDCFRHAIVEELACFGARIYVCDISEILLNQSLIEWEKKGFPVSGSICDVSSRPARETLMQTVSMMFDGKLNILVS